MVLRINPEFAKGVFVDPAPTIVEINAIAKRLGGNSTTADAARVFADDLAASVRKEGDQLFRSWVYKAVDFANHPDNVASSEFLKILRDACENEIIKASPRILEIAKVYEKLFADSSMGAGVDGVIAPIGKLAISDEKSRIAKSKNADIKNFVAEQWKIRTDKDQTKAAFSRLMVVVINKKFGKLFGADAIARGWIPR